MSSGFVDITTKSEAKGLFPLAPRCTTMLVVDAKNGNEQASELLAKRHLPRTLSVATNTLKPALRTAIELRALGELSTEETARRRGDCCRRCGYATRAARLRRM